MCASLGHGSSLSIQAADICGDTSFVETVKRGIYSKSLKLLLKMWRTLWNFVSSFAKGMQMLEDFFLRHKMVLVYPHYNLGCLIVGFSHNFASIAYISGTTAPVEQKAEKPKRHLHTRHRRRYNDPAESSSDDESAVIDTKATSRLQARTPSSDLEDNDLNRHNRYMRQS